MNSNDSVMEEIQQEQDQSKIVDSNHDAMITDIPEKITIENTDSTNENSNEFIVNNFVEDILPQNVEETVDIIKLNDDNINQKLKENIIDVNSDIIIEESSISMNLKNLSVEKMEEEKPELIVETINKEISKDINLNSLGIIAAAYDSDTNSCEDDIDLNQPIINKLQDKEINIVQEVISIDESTIANYRNKEQFNVSSDSEESSSSSSLSSLSSSDVESDEEDSSSDNTAKVISSKKKTKTHQIKGEFDDLPPIEQLNISVDEVLCEPLGKVGWSVEQMVVVIPNPGKPTLNLDTILFVDRGKRVLGRIFDVFGQVKEPHYCVRFNTSDHIKESNVKAGMTVYFVPNSEHTSLLFESELKKIRAIDEIDPDEEPYFSDDEAEEAYKQSKLKKKPVIAAKRSRPNWQTGHPWSTNNYSQRNNNQQKKWSNYQTQNSRNGQSYSNYNHSYPMESHQNNYNARYAGYPQFPSQTFKSNNNHQVSSVNKQSWVNHQVPTVAPAPASTEPSTKLPQPPL